MAAAPFKGAAQAIEGAPEGYSLVWQDEFNGTALNENIWNIEVSGSGGGNQELQYYRRENVSVANGNLVLTAKRENYQGKAFTSGRINSNQKEPSSMASCRLRSSSPRPPMVCGPPTG
jgi:beta-glucanase (GH16 family)